MCTHVCGFNNTNGSGKHRQWAKDPSAYRLTAQHPYVVENQKLAALSGTATSNQFQAPLVGQGPPSSQGPPSAVGSANAGQTSDLTGDTLTFSRATLQARFSTFEKNSTDPNAANIAAEMRTMFLN